VQVRITPVQSLAELEGQWRAIEAVVPDLSFFQSWSWVGCLAAERYPDPVLLQAEQDGAVVGLALFNRHRGRLHLAASGVPAVDAPFIEHNAPLILRPDAAPALFAAAWRAGDVRRLVLDGVSPPTLSAAGGTSLRLQQRLAPRVTLEAVRAAGGDYLATRSGNARYQLRRSLRAYAGRGPVGLRCAADATEALAWLEAMIRLHEATWQARGQPGAFATEYLRRFHHALVLRTMADRSLDLLQVTAGEETVGYLYNFHLRGQVSAYQSGLATATGHEKPGLTCHALAIERALAGGDAVYDFLGGADRYKLSLATDEAPLLWAELVPRWSPWGMVARMRRLVGRT
jgi:CelD/BcsL family acetyltransferase involved in cellulose biosynthesis